MRGIADVLASDDFRVPIYQRSYAWKDDTVDDFWSDLQGSSNSNDPDYFLGTLVLTTSEDSQAAHSDRRTAAARDHVAPTRRLNGHLFGAGRRRTG